MAAILVAVAPVAARPLPGQPGAPAPQLGLATEILVIETAGGRTHRYRVEVARTPEEQAHGMMFRWQVPEGTGMLFPMTPPRPASFWMRNTFVSLDLVFIGPGGRVLNVAARARPLSDDAISSAGPVIGVLELGAGEAERIGLRPGDRVRSPALGR